MKLTAQLHATVGYECVEHYIHYAVMTLKRGVIQRHRITHVILSEARPPLPVLVRQLLVHSCMEYRLNTLNGRYVRTKILFRD